MMKPDRALPGESQVKPPKPPTGHSGVSDAQPTKPLVLLEFDTEGYSYEDCFTKAVIIAGRYFGDMNITLTQDRATHVSRAISDAAGNHVVDTELFETRWIATAHPR